MKNRHLNRERNGKIFCLHRYEPNGYVGPDWDMPFNYVPVKCSKCGKVTELHGKYVYEWPDELIDPSIRYYI